MFLLNPWVAGLRGKASWVPRTTDFFLETEAVSPPPSFPPHCVNTSTGWQWELQAVLHKEETLSVWQLAIKKKIIILSISGWVSLWLNASTPKSLSRVETHPNGNYMKWDFGETISEWNPGQIMLHLPLQFNFCMLVVYMFLRMMCVK